MKLLMWDRQGVWLCARRLHQGTFYWPRDGDVPLVAHDGTVHLAYRRC
ncbi:IS66 family insertion sequence element accessory protein TnpB [Salmonella enterica subsp. enterica serovar Schwarzengrund]|nr:MULTISPECIES: IS66 family insertion sequence element accessory protein TnpB [Enterobacteriaceae]MDD8119853.1 IS66 family insertion sequence element accessory protein TnpB [Escherichia coli]